MRNPSPVLKFGVLGVVCFALLGFLITRIIGGLFALSNSPPHSMRPRS